MTTPALEPEPALISRHSILRPSRSCKAFQPLLRSGRRPLRLSRLRVGKPTIAIQARLSSLAGNPAVSGMAPGPGTLDVQNRGAESMRRSEVSSPAA
jgi:hypothetical protein